MTPRRTRIPTVLFWTVAALLLFGRLGSEALRGSEIRWAEVAREMLLTGDYFHPMRNGQPYFDKPLLGYWFIVFVGAVVGYVDEAVTRIPSAVAGLVALAATIDLTRRVANERQARTAGWVLLTMWGFVSFARTGEADMENLCAIVLAVAWYWARRDRPDFLGYLVFYLIAFLGAQAKGMAAIAVPCAVVLPDLLKDGRWKSHLRASNFIALGIAVAVYVLPLVYADHTATDYGSSGVGLAFKENVVRYFRPFDHAEPFYVYLYHLPGMMMPWAPLGLVAIWGACALFRRSDWDARWSLLALVMVFAFFTLSGSRRSYYIIPALPFCALLIGRLRDLAPGGRALPWAFRSQTALVGLVSILLIATPAVWPAVEQHYGFVPPRSLWFASWILGLLGLTPLLVERLRPGMMDRVLGIEPGFAVPLAMTTVLLAGFLMVQRPIFDRYRPTRPFALALKERIPGVPPENIAFAEFGELGEKTTSARIVFYLRLERPAPVLHEVEELHEFARTGDGPKVVISRARHHEVLRELLGEPALLETAHPWKDEHYVEMNRNAAWIFQPGPLAGDH